MFKIVRTLCAVSTIVAACPVAAQPKMAGGASVAHTGGTPFGGPGFGASHVGVTPVGFRYYGGVYRRGIYPGSGLAWRGALYRGADWAGRRGYYGDWRQSYSPYWGWGVGAELLATAPAYYYGVGYGDEYGYEVSIHDDAIAYCMRRFRSYDPVSGTYIGRDGYIHPCP